MYHFTYKIEHTNGKYYVGRHSTENLDDSYKGSGIWVNGIKDKSTLTRIILAFYNTFEELIKAEEILLCEHIGKPNNMNWNDRPVGFATGDRNPARNPKERKRRSEQNWMKTPEGRKWASECNASRKESVKQKLRENAKQQVANGTHNFQTPKAIASKPKFSSENNPMKRPEILAKFKVPQPIVACPHCRKEGGKSAMLRHHFNNCKHKSL